MSGGVDSAVAAALLHGEGHEVVGVTLRLYTEADGVALRSRRTCCGVEDVADARAAARRIGIPHYVLNMEREFERDVIAVFANAYAAGRTPNPCLECNDRVKFSTLLERAGALGIELLATGHYARIRERDGLLRLHAAADLAKDQSYVLYTLGQEQLARLRFPLGDLPKAETRRVAAELGLSVADKPDSTDICFVPGGDYRELLRARGVASQAGSVVDASGRELARHDGVTGFTVGQRRGLGIPQSAAARPTGHSATGQPGTGQPGTGQPGTGQAGTGQAGPRYVTAIDAAAGLVTVGDADALLAHGLEASAPRWVAGPPTPGEALLARVRSHGEATPAHLEERDGDGFRISLERPVRAVAPGQAVVLYRPGGATGDEVVGGGTIERGLR